MFLLQLFLVPLVVGELLKQILPTIATALGGPLAGVAVNFVASKLGIEPSETVVRQALLGMSGAEILAMKQADLEFQKHLADNGIKLDMAQIEANKEEAKNGSLFIAGWRPGAGWVGVASLAYIMLIEPVSRFVAKVFFEYNGEFPQIDAMVTFQLVGGLLGLSGLRTYEKFKRVEGNR